MSYSSRSRRGSYYRSRYRDSRSVSRSLSCFRSRSRSQDSRDAENPGNNLYVTGLSSRITRRELEKHFASEGKVIDVHLVMDPWTRESRGFGFVTMATIDDANCCLKYLDGSILEGRVITVEKARRRRGRTPTPGRYLGLQTSHGRRRSPSYSPYYRSRYSPPSYSSERDRSYSPYYRRHRSYSRSHSPYYWHSTRSPSRRHRSYSRSCSPYYWRSTRSPAMRHRSYSRDSRSYSPYNYVRYYRSVSCSASPPRRRSSRSPTPRERRRMRSYSRSISPKVRRHSRRSYSCSISPKSRRSLRRSYSQSYSPRPRKSKNRSMSSKSSRSNRYSRESYSHSRSSLSSPSRSASRSP